MPEIKPGTRMRSAVCTTEVMVVGAPKGEGVELTCGGAAMLAIDAEPGDGEPAPDFKEGTQLGKRYVDEAGTFEVLCTKPGEGSLSVGGAALTIKGAKPLPASD